VTCLVSGTVVRSARISVWCPLSGSPASRTTARGTITHQGPARVRKVLNQSVWSRIAHHPPTREVFADLERRAPKRKKIHVVGQMRKLGILLWHLGVEAQRRAGSYASA